MGGVIGYKARPLWQVGAAWTGLLVGGAPPGVVDTCRRGVDRALVDRPVPLVRALAATATSLLLVLTGCTSGSGPDDASSPVPSRSVRPGTTLEAKPVPLEVEVAAVAGGKLRGEKRARLKRRVTRLLETYVDAAFLGDYPRTDFDGAFAVFTRGAARQARGDRDLLTNHAVGDDLARVVPRRQTARLYVLRPYRRPVGLTARIRLVLDEQHSDGALRRATVRGRLVMKSNSPGSWKVFAYDVSRSSRPIDEGGAS